MGIFKEIGEEIPDRSDIRALKRKKIIFCVREAV